MEPEINYYIRDGKISANFSVLGNDYKVLAHHIHGKWQYYVNTRGCEAILNLDDQIFDAYNHDPRKIAHRLDKELCDILNMVSDNGWRPI